MDKQQAQQIIRDTFENPFDKGRFTGFIKNLLNRINEGSFTYQGNYIPDAYKQYIKTLERIGKFSDGENRLDILIITLQKETSLERARTMQRNFIAWYLNGSRGGDMKDAALVAYVSPDPADWRFSLVKMDYTFEKTKTGKMKVKEEFTPARRWSFLVGKNEKSHTAQSRLVNILADDKHAPTLAELEKAFDIETVTKEFFLKYRELFLRTKEALDKVVKNNPKVKADFEAKGVDTVNFAKKLMGQIVFLYFLQKKGWFGVGRDDDWENGSKHFLRQLFKRYKGESDTGISACGNNADATDKNVCATNNFFNDILEPLFYEALRIDRRHDDDYYSRFDCKIPFLNGGLFDPIGNYDWVHTDIHLPDDLFSNTRNTREGDEGDGILDVFDRYNFTVREDEPLEKEVAIDPELLGKTYEKFNAIRPDNFDEFTRALKSGKKGEENKFNKKFGVYYTPREIVHYMCKQSLVNYLFARAEEAELSSAIKKQDIEDLIEVGEMITEHEATALIKQENIRNGIQKSTEYTALLSDSIRKNAAAIDNWLAEITVCDPAVGSGAFPVGMMNEIVRARNVLSVFLQSNTGIPACDNDSTNTDKNVGVTITHRNLPHWTKEGSIYWITFRLADSLPQEKLNAWKAERDHWIAQHTEPWSDEEWEEYSEHFGERLEKWLDRGYGTYALSKLAIREIVQECILRFNEERLRLHAGVIMPNHVHLLLEPLAGNLLSELLKGIKGASSRKINQILGTTGNNFWMDESYDHIIRSEAQYQHFIRYIVENPLKANLSEDKYWLYSNTGSQGNTGIPACDKQSPAYGKVGDKGILVCDDNNTQTRMSVSHSRSDYEFKRRCIEHSLYGVDIDPGAVEIAKLRLWLSLLVDEEDIKNIKPLPNLDYKIVCGNSLLGEKDLFNHQLFNDLEKLKPLHFNETNPAKKQTYKKQIDDLIGRITKGGTGIPACDNNTQTGMSVPRDNNTQTGMSVPRDNNTQTGMSVPRDNNTQTGMSVPRFDFEVYFSEVFHEKGGFDVVIANPPYFLYQGHHKDELKDIKKSPLYDLCKGGKLNAYKLFLAKSSSLSKTQGIIVLIFQNSFLADNSAVNIRKHYLKNHRIIRIDSFPERDDYNKRVFEPVKMSVCVLVAITEKANDYTFVLRVWESRKMLTNWVTKFSKSSIKKYDEKTWQIPYLMESEKELFNKIFNGERNHVKCFEGEINMTFHKHLLNTNQTPPPVIKGAAVQRYFITQKMSQGILEYLDEPRYLAENKGKKSNHHNLDRIVMQGITGVDDKQRIIMAIANKGTYCANSCNYIISDDTYIIEALLGFFNSQIVNWMFKKSSTNSNVNCYEIEAIPIPKIDEILQKKISEHVGMILKFSRDEKSYSSSEKLGKIEYLQKQIDRLVYDLYGLTEEERRIVEGETK